MQVVFLSSGQGSQYFHMGKQLYEQHTDFKHYLNKLDAFYKSETGFSLVEIIYDKQKKGGDDFNRLAHTHPAVFIIQYALAQTLTGAGIQPDILLGSSLGEHVSCALATNQPAEEALAMVIQKAKIIEETCRPGAMLVVLASAELYKEEQTLFQHVALAGVNGDNHFVLAGEQDELNRIQQFLKQKEIIHQFLPVNYAFHSSGIDPARTAIATYLKTRTLPAVKKELISGVSGERMTEVPSLYFWDSVRQPLNFVKAIQVLEKKGSYHYIDLSPSGTLAGFVKQLIPAKSSSTVHLVFNRFGNDMRNFSQIEAAFKQLSIQNKEIMKTAWLFPGQGSQSKGMGADLFDLFPELVKKADELLGYSIKQLCLEDPNNQLMETRFTQPALYVVDVLTFLKNKKAGAIHPSYVAGHSLGEYPALFASGVFDFETGLKLVQKRGALMWDAKNGGMAALIGYTKEQVEEVLQKNKLDTIDVANLNTPTQIVISGLKKDVDASKAVFEASGIRMFMPLKVSGAFHSRYMQAAKEEFERFLVPFDFKEPEIPVISNTHARPYQFSEIKKTLAAQITSSVKWSESIQYMMGKGVDTFVEMGPGVILKGLVTKIKAEAQPLIVNDELSAEIKEVKKNGAQLNGVNGQEKLNGKRENGVMEKDNRIQLGSASFLKRHKVKYAYVAGGMYRGIASKELVLSMGNAGLLSFFGSGGFSHAVIEEAILFFKKELGKAKPWGINIVYNFNNPDFDEKLIDLFLQHEVKSVEAAAFMDIRPSLVRYRLKGIYKAGDTIVIPNKLMAKVSRPEVATAFFSPAPKEMVEKLLAQGKITQLEADLSAFIPMADDLTAEADSGGHTDMAASYALIPAMIRLRDDMMLQFKYQEKLCIGAAGGIGTPEAALASFMMGADYILTGSINQCTVEAGNSDAVKDILQSINVQDTAYAPAGDMFEIGAHVQVVKKSVFFPARANKLYDLYKAHNSIDDLDESTKKQLETSFFKRSLHDIYEETKTYFQKADPSQIEKAERNPKHKMALIFRWYFSFSSRVAFAGDITQRVNFQIHCGPALGAFNQWVKGTELESWRNRHVDRIAEKLMKETVQLLSQRMEMYKKMESKQEHLTALN